MMLYILLCLAILICTGSGASGAYWDQLGVTWRLNPAEPFAVMPSNVIKARLEGWQLESEHCRNGGLFNGYRYILNNDTGLALLFDLSGFVAGIQMNVLVSEIDTKVNTYHFEDVPAYIRNKLAGQDVYSLTAYFENPDTICTSGRGFLWSAFGKELGTDLYLQNGPTPEDYFQVPNKRDNLQRGWSFSNCIQGMGYHDYFGVDTLTPTNCDYLFPYALNYDAEHGKLRGFAYSTVGRFSSPRFEQSSTQAIVITIGKNAPQCLVDLPQTAGVTLMHVAFVKKPRDFTCPA